MLSYSEFVAATWSLRFDMFSAILFAGALVIAPTCLFAAGLQHLLGWLVPAIQRNGTIVAVVLGGVAGGAVMMLWPPLSLLAPDAVYTGAVAGYLSRQTRVFRPGWWAGVLAGGAGFTMVHSLVAPVLMPLILYMLSRLH